MHKNTNELPKYAYVLTEKGRRLAEEIKQAGGVDNYLLFKFLKEDLTLAKQLNKLLKKPKDLTNKKIYNRPSRRFFSYAIANYKFL